MTGIRFAPTRHVKDDTKFELPPLAPAPKLPAVPEKRADVTNCAPTSERQGFGRGGFGKA